MKFPAFLERNESTLKTTAAIIVTLAAALWAIIELIYPDLIKPAMEPGKVEITVEATKVGQTDEYTVHQIAFKINNVGVNRVFLPSTYFIATARRIVRWQPQQESSKFPEEEQKQKLIQEKVKKYLKSKYTPDQLIKIKAQASNMLIDNSWSKMLSNDDLSGLADIRSGFVFEKDSFQHVQIGRLTGLHESLSPGDTTHSQVLVIVPIEYNVLELVCKSIVSKGAIAQYAFIGAPTSEGIAILPIDKSEPLDTQIENLRKTIKENLSNNFYEKLYTDLPKGTFMVSRRMQFYIPNILKDHANRNPAGHQANDDSTSGIPD